MYFLMIRVYYRLKHLLLGNPRTKLLKLMPKNSLCAEVGVWQGNFSKEIIRIVSPKRLFLIDPWKHEKKFYSGSYWGSVIKSQKEMDSVFKKARKNLRRYVIDGTVKFIRDDSRNLKEHFPMNYLDWIYIDGNHSYENVKTDLVNASMITRKGGFITGDDYYNHFFGGGVRKAVNEYIRENPEKKVKIISTQYIIEN